MDRARRPGGRPSYPLEGQTGRDGGEVGGCSWGVCPEGLHIKTRERESAVMLCMPGRCSAESVKLCVAAMRKRLRKRCIMCGQWEVPDMMQCTTAWLSQSRRTLSVPLVTPIQCSQYHWVQLLPLDTVRLLCG